MSRRARVAAAPPTRLQRAGRIRSVPRLTACVVGLAVLLAATPLPVWVALLIIAAAGFLLPL